MTFIFMLSSLPGDTVDSMGLGEERLHINGHFIVYFFLMVTFFKATGNILRAMIYSFLFAVTDEVHQKFVPGRSAGLFDVFVDTIGALLAALILWKYYHLLPVKLRNWLEK